MAAAARPGPSDARVPCPLCGGLVHPIAGKCKHCKADLTSHHPVRPAASTPLPALQATATRNGHGYAPPSAPPAPAAPAVPVEVRGAKPVLPPRPPAHPSAPASSAWRSWPAVVISFAILAIVAALVLMVWPAARSELQVDHKSRLPPPPAPERMQTAPDIRQPAVAPRRDPAPAPAPADPTPQAAPADPPARDPGADSTSPDVDDHTTRDIDPMPNPLTPQAPGGAVLQPSGNPLALAMAGRLCRKMIQCGTVDHSTRDMCEPLVRAARPPRCAAARRCLAHIDQIACSAQASLLSQVNDLLTQSADCADALHC
jgi:hypothetical protein